MSAYRSPLATPGREGLTQLAHLSPGQVKSARCMFCSRVVQACCCARDRNDVLALGHQPRDGQLRRGTAVRAAACPQPRCHCRVGPQVVTQEPRMLPADVLRRELAGIGETAGQEAAADRAVGDEANAQLADGRQDLTLHITRPEAVLGLQRGDRVGGMSAADGGGRRLGEAEVAHLAGGDQLAHGADGLLDRNLGVHPMQVVQVDVVDTEAGKRCVARLRHVGRIAVDPEKRSVVTPDVAELGADDHQVAAPGERLADQPLVGEGPVGVSGVEERAAQFERAGQHPQ